MVDRGIVFGGVALVALALACRAEAQQVNGLNSGLGDTVSPYLNLLSVNQFGINTSYQTLVKPQIDAREAINSNAAGIQRLQGQIGSRGGSGGNAGLSRHFMNYSHFYISPRR